MVFYSTPSHLNEVVSEKSNDDETNSTDNSSVSSSDEISNKEEIILENITENDEEINLEKTTEIDIENNEANLSIQLNQNTPQDTQNTQYIQNIQNTQKTQINPIKQNPQNTQNDDTHAINIQNNAIKTNKNQHAISIINKFSFEEKKDLIEACSIQKMLPRPFSKNLISKINNREFYLPENVQPREYLVDVMNKIYYRLILFDSPKLIITVILALLLNLSIIIFICWGIFTTIFTSVLNQVWMLYVLLGLFFIVSISFIIFTCFYIFTFDYVPFFLKCFREISFLETRLPLKIIGLNQDYKNRNWNVGTVEFLLHLLWIPLTVLLYSIKLLASKDSLTWTYWTIPAYLIWGVYIVTTFFNIIFDSIQMFLSKQKFGILNLLIGIFRFTYYWIILLFIIPFYTLLFIGSILILGKVDGWLNAPWIVGFSFISASLIVIFVFLLTFPILNLFHHNIGYDNIILNRIFRSVSKRWMIYQIAFNIQYSICQLLYEFQIYIWINQLWPLIVTLILTGLKLDNTLNIHWGWVCSPIPIWVVSTFLFNCAFYVLFSCCSFCIGSPLISNSIKIINLILKKFAD